MKRLEHADQRHPQVARADVAGDRHALAGSGDIAGFGHRGGDFLRDVSSLKPLNTNDIVRTQQPELLGLRGQRCPRSACATVSTGV